MYRIEQMDELKPLGEISEMPQSDNVQFPNGILSKKEYTVKSPNYNIKDIYKMSFRKIPKLSQNEKTLTKQVKTIVNYFTHHNIPTDTESYSIDGVMSRDLFLQTYNDKIESEKKIAQKVKKQTKKETDKQVAMEKAIEMNKKHFDESKFKNVFKNVLREIKNRNFLKQSVKDLIYKQRIKQIMKPMISHYNKYQMYTVPSVISSYLEKENVLTNPITQEKIYIEMSDVQLEKHIQNINQYIKPIIAKSILKFKFIRLFIIVNFKSYNTTDQNLFIQTYNFGKIDINSLQEYEEYFYQKFIDCFNKANGKDYVRVYGIGDIDINVLQYNPLQGSSYQPIPDTIKKYKIYYQHQERR